MSSVVAVMVLMGLSFLIAFIGIFVYWVRVDRDIENTLKSWGKPHDSP